MTEEQTGVLEAGVTDQNLTDDQTQNVAAEPDVNDPSLSERERGLLQAKIAETKKRQELEASIPQQINEAIQRQMLINQAQMQQYQQQPDEYSDPYSKYLTARGIDPDTVLTAREQAQLMAEFVQLNNQSVNADNFIHQNTDFADVVGYRTATGRFVKKDGSDSEFQKALNKHPYLAQSQLDNRSAYAIGKEHMASTMINTSQQQAQHLAGQAATAPMAGVSAGGGAVLPNDAGVENMDPNSAEFHKYLQDVKDGII